MGWIGEKFAGLEALCKYYVEPGIDASVLPDDSSEALEKGLIRKDMGYIKVTGLNFDLVTIRMKGTTSGLLVYTVILNSTSSLPPSTALEHSSVVLLHLLFTRV